MDFSLSEDQRAIAEMASGLFADHGGDDRIRAIYESGDVFDAELWSRLAETGLLSLALPEAAGGSGLGMLDLMLALEQQGRALGAVPYWRHHLASLAIASFGSGRLRAMLPALAEGSAIASLCNEETAVAARRSGDGWTLHGTAESVVLGRHVQHLLLPVEDGRLTVIDPRAISRIEGLSTSYEPVATLRFDGVAVPDDAMLTPAGPDWLDTRIALSVAAMQLGVTTEALRRAAAYAGERQQFGRPIGSFQAVAVRMADAYIETELLRTAVWQLAWRLDAGLPAAAAARVAKYQAAQAGHIVGHTAQHYHGGVGADLTYPIHRFFLWSRALELTAGSAEAQLAQLAEDLPEFDS